MITKYYHCLLLLTAFLLGLVSCSDKPSPVQSEKLIRAADAEITGIARRLAETNGLKALREVFTLEGISLPMMQDAGSMEADAFRSADHTPSKYVRVDTTSEGYLQIRFPYHFKNDTLAIFTLRSWETEKSLLMDDFPTSFSCVIASAGGVKLLEINYKARIKHQLPESYSFELQSGGFYVSSDLKTHFRKKNSNIRLNFSLAEDGQTKIKTRIHSMVALSSDGSIQFGRKNISFEAFPVLVDARSEGGYHSYDPRHFVRDFNADHRILIFDHEMNHLGNIHLVEKPGKDYINPVVTLNNGQEFEIEELMMSVRQLLRMKLHNL
ncbi:MAG: hypothetical protein LWX09_02765 [Bacteroidia bacterium]|nr:hypothetical protein [Bacteroidia bacterium]